MKPKKGKIIVSGVCAAAMLITRISVWGYQKSDSQEDNTVYKEVTAEKGTLTVGVTESGSVTIGTITQDMDFEESTSGSNSTAGMGTNAGNTGSSGSSAALEVEEVYVSVGQNVTEGEALLKISEESIAEYREELEEAVTTAAVSVSEAKLSSAKQQLEASYNYDSSIAKGTVAEETHNATITQLQTAIDEAQEAYDEQNDMVAYYQSLVSSGEDEYADELSEAKTALASCESKLKKAQNEYTTKSIEAEKTYQETMLAYNNASSQYTVDVNGIDSDMEDAQEELSDAKEALEEFEAFIGDGVIYSDYTGMITAVGYEAGDELSSDTSIVTFADTDSVTMTVSVSQEDISDIAIGDEVNIELTAYEDQIFKGTVSGMDTSSSSGSSTVSYNVTVVFSGDITGVYADMTGNVTFIQKQMEDVVYVSNKAIINEGTSSYVKVKNEDGTISKVEVITGFSDGVNVEISSGLTEGDTVLIEGQVVNE